MLIVCPNCATSYRVAPSSLGAAGRSVRCVRCKNTWFAVNPGDTAASGHSGHEAAAALAAIAAAERPPTEGAPAPAPLSAAPESFPVLDVAPPSAPADPAAPEPPAEMAPDDRGPAPPRERIEEAPPATPAAEETRPAAANDPPATERTDVETTAWRRQSKAARRRAAAAARRWAAVIVALVAINAGLVGWRAEIVRLLPQTAPLYAAIGLPVNLRGLTFGEIVTRNEEHDGVPMLVIEGTIKSTGPRGADVPRLRFAVRNAQGQEIHSWTALPASNVLAPGDVLPFRTRLASPPPEAHAVLVRFFNRRDLVAGSQ